MKILQLTKKFPYPLKDGEAIAVTYLGKALRALNCELSLLSMNTRKHPFDLKQLPKEFNHYKAIHMVDIDNRVKISGALLNLFSKRSYHIERFISEEFNNKLIELLEKEDFDVVHLETLYLAPYIDTIRKHSKAKIAMRSHNVEHEIWKRIAKNTSTGAKKWYLNLLTRRLENFEVQQLNKYDMMVAITERDLKFFRDLGMTIDAIAAPIGLDLNDYPQQVITNCKNPSFCFIGSLDWMPNIEGLRWLLEKVWPCVIEKIPEAEFHIAGRNTPEWLQQADTKGITVHGEVDSATEFICQYDAMLVPLLSGSGMRVKILEGMAMARLVISTHIGLEGIRAQDGQQVFIADTPQRYADKIVEAYLHPQRVVEMGAAARQFIHQHYDNQKIAAKVVEKYNLLLQPKKKQVSRVKSQEG